MNTIKFLIVVSIALLSTDLIYHQVNGLTFDDNGQIYDDNRTTTTFQRLNTTQLNQNYTDHLTQLEKGLQEQKESLNPLINYCYQHADRHNPLQDLIDKGLLFPAFKGFTCLDIEDIISDIDNRITVVQTELNEYWENVEVQRR